MSLVLSRPASIAKIVRKLHPQWVRSGNAALARANLCPYRRLQALSSFQGFSSQDDAQSKNKRRLDKTKDTAKQVTSKFRELVNKYGAVGVATYFSVYGVTLTSMFLLFDFEILPSTFFGYSAQDAMLKLSHMLESIHVPEAYLEPMRSNPTVAKFALAYLATKLTEPIRLIGTIAVTPKIAKWLKQRKDSKYGDSHDDDHDSDSEDEEAGRERRARKSS